MEKGSYKYRNKFTLKVGLLYCSSLPFGLNSILFKNVKHDNYI